MFDWALNTLLPRTQRRQAFVKRKKLKNETYQKILEIKMNYVIQ